MQWTVEQYVPEGDPITYVVESINVGSLPFSIERNNEVSSAILYMKKNSSSAADVTTSLTVITQGMQNRTSISCRTFIGNTLFQTFSILYFAGNILYSLLHNALPLYRCATFERYLDHLSREGDIFHSCTGVRRYV